MNVTPGISRSEALTVLGRIDESLDHLSLNKIAVELVQFVKPEVVAVKVRVGSVVRVPSEITEVLHQHKGAVEFGTDKIGIFRYRSQNLRARLPACRQVVYQLIALRLRQRTTGVAVELVNKLGCRG